MPMSRRRPRSCSRMRPPAARRSAPARASGWRRRPGRGRRRLACRSGGRVIAVAGNAKTFWYLTRGTGIVALLLLTASIVLGVLTTSRWRTPRWPRFALSAVHRNLTLLTLVSSSCMSSPPCSTATRRSASSMRSSHSAPPTVRCGSGSERSRSTCCSRSLSRACCGLDSGTGFGGRSTGSRTPRGRWRWSMRSALAAMPEAASCCSQASVRSPSSPSPCWRASLSSPACNGPCRSRRHSPR